MKGRPLDLEGYIETFPICNKLDRNKSEILEGIVNWITFYVLGGKVFRDFCSISGIKAV